MIMFSYPLFRDYISVPLFSGDDSPRQHHQTRMFFFPSVAYQPLQTVYQSLKKAINTSQSIPAHPEKTENSTEATYASSSAAGDNSGPAISGALSNASSLLLETEQLQQKLDLALLTCKNSNLNTRPYRASSKPSFGTPKPFYFNTHSQPQDVADLKPAVPKFGISCHLAMFFACIAMVIVYFFAVEQAKLRLDIPPV